MENEALSYLFAALAVCYVLVKFKSSRPDGAYLKNIHPYRKTMIQLMPTVSMAQVSLEHRLNAEPILEFIKHNTRIKNLDINHFMIAMVNHAIANNPELDRFVMGGRIYQRHQRSISFSIKKEKMNSKSALGTIKLNMIDGESLTDLCSRIDKAVSHERQPSPTKLDKEYKLLSFIPTPLLKALINLGYWLNRHHLLPGFFIKSDMLHTSALIANMGSLGMNAVSHHLYDWGTCPIFIAFGQVEDTPVVENGQIIVRKTIPIKFNYDERLSDGLTAWNTIKSFTSAAENPIDFELQK
jgi:hypothetical protein